MAECHGERENDQCPGVTEVARKRQTRKGVNAVFLSASVPDPERNGKYFETADNIAIRDAVTALVELVLPVTRLYFGGHPAITPMVRVSAHRLGLLENVRNYQSTWYEEFF